MSSRVAAFSDPRQEGLHDELEFTPDWPVRCEFQVHRKSSRTHALKPAFCVGGGGIGKLGA